MTKKGEEIMAILESYDLTRCARSAAELARMVAALARFWFILQREEPDMTGTSRLT